MPPAKGTPGLQECNAPEIRPPSVAGRRTSGPAAADINIFNFFRRQRETQVRPFPPLHQDKKSYMPCKKNYMPPKKSFPAGKFIEKRASHAQKKTASAVLHDLIPQIYYIFSPKANSVKTGTAVRGHLLVISATIPRPAAHIFRPHVRHTVRAIRTGGHVGRILCVLMRKCLLRLEKNIVILRRKNITPC